MTDHLQAYIHGIKYTFGDKAKHLQIKKFTAKPDNNIIERMQGTIKERTKVMRDLKSFDSAQLILDGFLVDYNYFRPHETLGITPASKAQIQFPYDDWEVFIRHTPLLKQQETVAQPIPEPLPYIKPTAIEQKRAEVRLYKRRKLEVQRTGIPYKPKSRPTGKRKPKPTYQTIRKLRSYK